MAGPPPRPQAPVVLVSRCDRGRVVPVYGGPGGGRTLHDMGVIDEVCPRGGGRQAVRRFIAAAGQALDVLEFGQAADIDEPIRTGDARLHQIEQVGACGEKSGARICGGRDGLGDGCGPEVIENLHAAFLRSASASFFWASSTASVMPA